MKTYKELINSLRPIIAKKLEEQILSTKGQEVLEGLKKRLYGEIFDLVYEALPDYLEDSEGLPNIWVQVAKGHFNKPV